MSSDEMEFERVLRQAAEQLKVCREQLKANNEQLKANNARIDAALVRICAKLDRVKERIEQLTTERNNAQADCEQAERDLRQFVKQMAAVLGVEGWAVDGRRKCIERAAEVTRERDQWRRRAKQSARIIRDLWRAMHRDGPPSNRLPDGFEDVHTLEDMLAAGAWRRIGRLVRVERMLARSAWPVLTQTLRERESELDRVERSNTNALHALLILCKEFPPPWRAGPNGDDAWLEDEDAQEWSIVAQNDEIVLERDGPRGDRGDQLPESNREECERLARTFNLLVKELQALNSEALSNSGGLHFEAVPPMPEPACTSMRDAMRNFGVSEADLVFRPALGRVEVQARAAHPELVARWLHTSLAAGWAVVPTTTGDGEVKSEVVRDIEGNPHEYRFHWSEGGYSSEPRLSVERDASGPDDMEVCDDRQT